MCVTEQVNEDVLMEILTPVMQILLLHECYMGQKRATMLYARETGQRGMKTEPVRYLKPYDVH